MHEQEGNEDRSPKETMQNIKLMHAVLETATPTQWHIHSCAIPSPCTQNVARQCTCPMVPCHARQCSVSTKKRRLMDLDTVALTEECSSRVLSKISN
ncbi:hypothetical protein HAX54_022187, partial [Datura stramonium]|nr:hypothetical protein [Datura stramonium]